MLMCLSGIYQFLCVAGNTTQPAGNTTEPVGNTTQPAGYTTQPADHKLRIYSSLMLHSNILNFTWHTVLVNHQYEHYASKTYTILEFGLIFNATTKITIVWHFDFSMLSVYGREAWLNAISFLHDEKMKTHPPFVVKWKYNQQSKIKTHPPLGVKWKYNQ